MRQVKVLGVFAVVLLSAFVMMPFVQAADEAAAPAPVEGVKTVAQGTGEVTAKTVEGSGTVVGTVAEGSANAAGTTVEAAANGAGTVVAAVTGQLPEKKEVKSANAANQNQVETTCTKTQAKCNFVPKNKKTK